MSTDFQAENKMEEKNKKKNILFFLFYYENLKKKEFISYFSLSTINNYSLISNF